MIDQPTSQPTLQTNTYTWRDFQTDLNRQSRKQRLFLTVIRRLLPALIVILTLSCLFMGINRFWPESQTDNPGSREPDQADSRIPDQTEKTEPVFAKTASVPVEPIVPDTLLSKVSIRKLISDQNLMNLDHKSLTISNDNEILTFETTLDMPLQKFILSLIEDLKPLSRGKPRRIAMVAMEPSTGNILAMAGFDLENPGCNPCTLSDYPAASLFKIITAAAAVETRGYTPDTPIYFNGGKYTLYKRQIKEGKNKYSTKTSFANAFAESINPVFGRIGAIELGGEILEQYASAFGFNRPLTSEMNMQPGSVTFSDTVYQLAEVGCGFNKTTTISPVFGAVMSSTLLNRGMRPEPSLVQSIRNAQGDLVYRRPPTALVSAVEPETALTVLTMMEKTVSSGTASGSFRGFRKDAILSRLSMGGKTGSLYSSDNTIKYDWFTGFAKNPIDQKQIAVAIVVGHGKYIGTRAAQFGKMIFKDYFTRYYARKSQAADKQG
ncbi:MAG: penicillin-binding transpeptidase domain-containing protein [Pseudomonadota bacterium]